MHKPLDIFRKVNELADVHYTNEQNSHANFLSACNKVLAEYFKGYFKDGFIFSALSFAKNNQLHYVDEDINNGYILNKESVENWSELLDLFKKYIKEVSDKEIISITKILLDKNNTTVRKDLFFSCCADCKYGSDILGNDGAKVFEYELGIFNADKQSYYKTNRSKLDKFYEAFSENSYEQNKNLYDGYIWDYHELAHKYKTVNDKSDFLLHFIKPSIAELDHGLLLSLATNRKLTSDELVFVNLILYRVVSQTATEKMREAERLKTKTMFSLTTHSLKTHLNTTVIKEKNAFLDKLENHNELKEDFEKYLGKEVDTLFRLTEILSLVDKINDKQKFIDTAKGTELLSESIATYNLEEHLTQFNRRKKIERTEPDIKICSEANLAAFTLPINIYNLYFGKDLLELFFNTIFENIVVYGKVENGCRTLIIKSEKNQMVFSNEAKDRTIQLDETKLTGNYRLFKKLLVDTDSGQLSIPPVADHKFKIIIGYGK